MSANNACAQYGVTMADLSEANVKCQWRSCHGNSYAVVTGSDVAALAAKLRGERKKAEEAALVAELGVDGLQAMR